VLLNHTDDIRSVETLAHEMGHAIHTELTKKNQPPRYQHYSIATAEVASTFFEQLVNEELEKTLSDKEKVILLHNKILGDISTIFRQIACFNFELELHNSIREKGQLSKSEIAKLMNKHFSSYLGSVVELQEDDGYFFVTWSHIRRFFYVYSYAYGQIISRALFENWKKDNSYIEKIDQFLSAGKSMSPKDIFKNIGIDTSDPKFFESGLKAISKDIDKLEKLAKKAKMI
jgi:oligoendopeptidase F